MPGTGFPWTPLNPSRARRRWLLAGATVSAALALILLSPAWRDPSPTLIAAAFIAALAAGAAAVAARRPEPAWALLVDADGAIWGRMSTPEHEPGLPIRLVPSVFGRQRVVLTCASAAVAVWRDALPVERFRRLSAHARWHLERSQAQSGPSPAAPHPVA